VRPSEGPRDRSTPGDLERVDLDAVDLAAVAASFAGLLHAAGVPATPERAGRFADAVALAEPASTEELRWLARVTLLTGVGQVETFERVFRQAFAGLVDVADWRGDSNAPPPAHTRLGTRHAPRPGASPAPEAEESRPGASGSPGDEPGDGPEPESVLAAASSEERLRNASFAACTPEELAVVRQLIDGLRVHPPRRPSRRRAVHPLGDRLDRRATLRRAHRTGGDPVRRIRRARRERNRRIVLLADVSGSMEPYARAYLHLLHGAVRAARAETFVFATRLTRLTRALAVSDVDVAMARAAAAMPDWSGGTRIGAALAAFNDGWGRRGLARGAVVVIVSDGWERDDPTVLAEQMARLRRLAHRIVWVNPRQAATAYQPLVGGMAAALPHVDVFLPGHSVGALEDVLIAIAEPPRRTRPVPPE
jgi:uncharacterized protein with von Willebrand factor type A (vWA) domain